MHSQAPNLDLHWARRRLDELRTVLLEAQGNAVADAAVELASVLEVGAELVEQLDLRIAALREEIAAIDADRADRELLVTESPTLSRRVLPWQVRRQALAWLWRPYTQDPEGLGALREALEAAALAAHGEACKVFGATGVAPLVRQRLVRIVEHAVRDLRSHGRTLDRAFRCERNLVTVRRALSGEQIQARPRPLDRRAPDPLRAAARAVVPYAAREAALNWLWEPHLAAA